MQEGIKKISTAAILGGGPAGATLGCLLAQAGIEVTIYHNEKRPEIIVGESLIPALIPFLRRLGVEEHIAAKSTYKQGATLILHPDSVEWNLDFSKIKGCEIPYAYNVPRDMFDAVLLERAKELGCKVVPSFCKLQKGTEADSVSLPRGEPEVDFIFDATGRSRQIARLLDIEAETGLRDDTALFAHLDKAELSHEGNLHINVLEDGWSWRIPLPGRVSVGIVAPKKYFAKFGANAQEQYDQILKEETFIAPHVSSSTRLTSVAKYSNYQLLSTRMFGKNWAMLGDASGFVDPIFSSGLFVSLYSAELLANSLINQGTTGLAHYQEELRTEFIQWQKLIAAFYDGRFFALIRHANSLDPKITDRLNTGRTIGLLLAGFGYKHRDLSSSFEWILDFCQKFDEQPRIHQRRA